MSALLEDLDLQLEHPVLAAQRNRLGAFIAAQARLVAVIDIGLGYPFTQTAVGDPEIPGDLRERLLEPPGKLHLTTDGTPTDVDEASGLLRDDHTPAISKRLAG